MAAGDMSVSVRWSTEGFSAALSDLKARVRDKTLEGVEEGGAALAAQARANAVVNPHVRTGRLDASITASEVEDSGDGHYRVEVAPRGVVYARAQELGAFITARRAEYLRIPVVSVYGIGPGVGAVANFTRLGERERTHSFIYRRHVTLPPRPYLHPALDEQTQPYLDTMTEKWGDAVTG